MKRMRQGLSQVLKESIVHVPNPDSCRCRRLAVKDSKVCNRLWTRWEGMSYWTLVLHSMFIVAAHPAVSPYQLPN